MILYRYDKIRTSQQILLNILIYSAEIETTLNFSSIFFMCYHFNRKIFELGDVFFGVSHMNMCYFSLFLMYHHFGLTYR